MIKRVLGFIKLVIRVAQNYDTEQTILKDTLRGHSTRIGNIAALLRDMTEVNADIGPRETNSIIVIGRYKGRDYIQTFVFPPDAFHDVVDRLRNMQNLHTINVVDAPPTLKRTITRGRW